MSSKTSLQQKVDKVKYFKFRTALLTAGKNGEAISIAQGVENAMDDYVEKKEKEQKDGKK
jgi:hypothetical protein